MLYISDAVIEGEASPQVSKSAASASPRRFDASPRFCLGLNIMTSKLRNCGIITHNFHPFIFCIYVIKTYKNKLLLYKCSIFRCKLNVFGVCLLPHEFSLVHLHGFLTALSRPR